MRRVNGIAAVHRAVVRFVAAPSVARNHPHHHGRLFEGTLFSTNSSNNSSARPLWFLNNTISGDQLTRAAAHTFAGKMPFSAAATTLAEGVHSKEPPLPKYCLKDVVLYQYEACPFCNKVKAFLDYHNIPYEIVEVNPMSRKEIKWSDHKKVPILMVDGEQMVDSTDIITKLANRIYPVPVGANDEENKWRGWVDNHLVHILSPNIYRTVSEALESFDYITTHGNFSFIERVTRKYAGAAAMYFISKILKKRYNITDERASLYEAAETWVDALEDRDFKGGRMPNLADLAVFGVLRPIRHLKCGRDMVKHTRIGDWYSRMENSFGPMCNHGKIDRNTYFFPFCCNEY